MIPFPLRIKLGFELRRWLRGMTALRNLGRFEMGLWGRVLWPICRRRTAHYFRLVGEGGLAALKTLAIRVVALVRRRPLVALALIEHFGDIVAAEPLVQEVRRRHPRAIIVWIVRRHYRSLVAFHPDIGATVVVPCLTAVLVMRRSHLFDAFYDCHLRLRACAICAIATEGNSDCPEITQASYYNHGCLLDVFGQTAGLGRVDGSPRLFIPKAVYDNVRRFEPSSPFCVIHRHSNEPARDWNDDGWVRLCDWLKRAYGLMVVEIGAAGRQPLQAKSDFSSLAGRLSLLETAALMAHARVFVGIDSGPAHFANALRVPSVVLLGHYLGFRRRMPYSGWLADPENAVVLQWDAPSPEIPIEEVKAAVNRVLAREVVGESVAGAF